MSTLNEFTLFSDLPTEVRLLIWEHVPQPVRVVGYLPCAECWSSFKLQEPQRYEARNHYALGHHPDWKLRYVVQPREYAVFPPLHACRELRAIWLPRYFRPPRYLTLPKGEGYKLRFDVPFISYEKDIMTTWNIWTLGDITDCVVREPSYEFPIFLGLDRTQIQHVGFGEISERFLSAITALALPALPCLRALSLLATGLDLATSHQWLEMPVISVQQVNCELRDIPEASLLYHPFFNQYRPRHPISQLAPTIRPLYRYWTVLKAWLWHEQQWTVRPTPIPEEDPWWEFLDYVLGDREECPLEQVEVWDTRNHSKQEMLHWKPRIDLDCKLLCEKDTVMILDTLSVFDIAYDPVGVYEQFFRFRKAQMALSARK